MWAKPPAIGLVYFYDGHRGESASVTGSETNRNANQTSLV